MASGRGLQGPLFDTVDQGRTALDQGDDLGPVQRAALVVGTKLLSGLMLDHRKDADDLFAPLRPHMGEFIRSLKERGRDAG